MDTRTREEGSNTDVPESIPDPCTNGRTATDLPGSDIVYLVGPGYPVSARYLPSPRGYPRSIGFPP